MDLDRPFKHIAEFLPDMASRSELLDLRPALRKTAGTQPVFFPRDSHFNGKGHEITAEELAKWLEPEIEKAVKSNRN